MPVNDPLTQSQVSPTANTIEFPSHVNDILPAHLIDLKGQELSARQAANSRDRENFYPSMEVIAGFNDDNSCLINYLDRILSIIKIKGKILLYGAGTLTQRSIDYLQSRNELDVVGILDQKADRIKSFCDTPVYLPSDHQQVAYDYLLILHFHWELDMEKAAISSGIPEAKIIKGITSDVMQHDYLKKAAQEQTQNLASQSKAKSNIVLTTLAPKWSVLGEGDTKQLFPPENTNYIVYTNPNMHLEAWQKSDHPFIHCPRSRPFLKLLLEALAPTSILLRVTPHTNSEWLPAFVRSILPDTRILVEFYDMSALFSEPFLKEKLDYSQTDIEVAKASTYQSMKNTVDCLVVKSGGTLWNKLQQSITTPTVQYFPLLPGNTVDISHNKSTPIKIRKPIAPKPSCAIKKIIYAGSVPADEIKYGLGSFPGANMFRYLYNMTEQGEIQVDLFNAGDHDHFSGIGDDNKLLRETFASGPIRYYPSIPYETLLLKAQEYDFGFTAVHYAGDFTENVTRSGVGNRFMGYIMAGLPVIIDSYFEYQAELVREFNAGIVIEPEEIETLGLQVAQANMKELREGVQSLYEFMLRNNQHSYSLVKHSLKLVKEKC